MTVLRHCVTVRALEADRVQVLARALVDFAESTRAHHHEILLADGRPVTDVRLVKGRHLRPGARYEGVAQAREDAGPAEQSVLLVREWRRGHAIAVEQQLISDELTARIALRLRSPDHPRLLEAEGRVRGPEGSGSLQRGSGKARLDLAAWWAAVECLPGAPPAARAPATARLRHRLGEARLFLRPQRVDEATWQVDVAVTVRGRWLLRPVVALALMVAGGRLRRGFRSGVEQAAAGWNRAVDELSALGTEDLRAEMERQATERTPEEDVEEKGVAE